MNGNAQIHYRDLPVSHPSGRTHSQLHQLKKKLLRVALEETPETELFKRLCGAANQAAELAWATSNPFHVYPSLLDEMVTAVRERFQQEQISDAQSSLTSLDADLRFEGIHSVSRVSDPISTGGGVSGRLTKTPTRGNRTAGQTARLPHIERLPKKTMNGSHPTMPFYSSLTIKLGCSQESETSL